MTTRIKRTRTDTALDHALLRLIEQKSAYRISVRELCTEANVGKSTFYRRYNDMQQYLEVFACYAVQGLIDACDPDTMSPWKKDSSYYVQWCTYIYRNRKAFLLLLSNNGIIEFREYLVSNGIETYRRKLASQSSLLKPPLTLNVISSYLVSAHIGVMEQWLKHGCPDPPEILAQQLSKLSIEGALLSAGVRSGASLPR